MKKKILLVGAGAIGRGYLPWIIDTDQYSLHFVESNPELRNLLQAKDSFLSVMAVKDQLEKKTVPVERCFAPEDQDWAQTEYAAVFVQVGPRNCLSILEQMKVFKCPIILCENDSHLVDKARQDLGLKNVFFGVPDVITSNTAPAELLKEDPLTVVTEEGVLLVDEAAGKLEGLDIDWVSESELLNQHWAAKLYIHNTPHCVAAYLGHLVGKTYLHEAMQVPEVQKIVQGSMNEMLRSLKLNWEIPHDYLDWYAEKELRRFSNVLLFDPIKRVAREPLRKLELNGRLIGAANICLSQGFMPSNILVGIMAALFFDSETDSDSHLPFMRKSMSKETLFSHCLGLRSGEAIELALVRRYDVIAEQLVTLKLKMRGK